MYVWKNAKGVSVVPKRVRVNRLTSRNNTTGLYLASGSIQIGKGAYGTVNLAYNIGGRRKYAIKKSDENMSHEVGLTRKLKRLVPEAVPTVYSGNSLSLKTNYISGGSLENWLNKNKKFLTDHDVSLIIIQVLNILQRLSTLDPTFRHNDLHIGNVLVDDDANKPAPNATGLRIMLTDFGLSRDSEFRNPLFEVQPQTNWAKDLRKNYGIYVGNDKMYDAIVFLNSIFTKTKFKGVNSVIRRILKGIRLQNGRPREGEHISHTFSNLISYFSKQEPQNINISGLFRQNIKEFAKGKKLSNLAMMNLRSLFPNVSDAQFMRNIGFIPKRDTKKNVSIPVIFRTPPKLKNKATLGVPKVKPSTSRMRNVFLGKRSPSPFRQNKFNTANLTKTRPKNVENYVKQKGMKESDAKNMIERIVRTKRKEAWEKAQEMLKGQVNISRR
jgi:serine/threonine protein kinase